MKKTAAWFILFISWPFIIMCNIGASHKEYSVEETPVSPPTEISEPTNSQLFLTSPLCSEPYPSLISNFNILQPSKSQEPLPRNPFRDPVFGTCLVRVTDRNTDINDEDSSQGMKNEYSRVQSFNADGSAILVRSTEMFWYLYDSASLQPQGILPLENGPRWDSDNPNLIYHNDETRLMSYDLQTKDNRLIHDFANDFPNQSISAVWTHFEGRPSMDSRFWGLIAEDENWLPVAFVIYDKKNDQATIRYMRNVKGIEEDIDHVTISPLRTYFLASYDKHCEHGEPGNDENPCGLMIYDQNLSNGRGLLRIIGHYDTAIDTQGQEVIIYQDIDNDSISMLNLKDGKISELWPIDFRHSPIGFHFSGLAYDKPGWALISTYSGSFPESQTWMDDQVFAVELKKEGRVVRLAHTHSLVNEDMEHDYWAEPHASVNRDFTRILFTSNWGNSGSEKVEMYMLELPPDWEDTLIP